MNFALERIGGSSPEAAKEALDDAELSTAIKLDRDAWEGIG